MKIISLALLSLTISITLGITGCNTQNPTSQNPTPEGFAIYLTRENISVSQMPELSHFELADKPVISVDDIISYTRDTHEIELTADAYERVTTMKVPTSGKAFVVCVGSKQVYWGAFWAPYSSQSFDGVTIWLPSLSKENVVKLTLGYPSAGFYRGKDPRSNPEIFQSLKQAGKLK
jgi:hypothetical protein